MAILLPLPALIASHPTVLSQPAIAAALQDGTLPIPLADDVAAELEDVSATIAADDTNSRRLRLHAAVATMMSKLWQKEEGANEDEVDEDEAKELAKTYVETFAKTLRGVDLYLDFAPEQARDSWRYSDGNEVVSDVIELLRLLECEDSDAEGEENDGDEEGEEDDGDEEGEEEDGSPKVKFPAELVESSGFLSWVDNYGPHGIACPIPSDQLNYITMVGINALAEAEGATRLQRSSILRGILTAVALRDKNTLWEGHDDSPDAVKEVVAEVEKNVAVGFELVKGWLEEVGDGEMEKKEEPSWMMKKQKIEEVNEDGSNDEEAEPQDEDNDEAEDEDKEPDNMSGEDEDKEPENMNGEDEDKVDSDSDSDSDAEDEEQVIFTLTRNHEEAEEDDEDSNFKAVPTAEESAAYIWNQLSSIETQLKDKAIREAEEIASRPATKWETEHGKLTFTLPTEMYAGMLAAESYPFTEAAIARGSIEAPYPPKAHVHESTAPLSELWSGEVLTRAQKASLHYLLKISEHAGDADSEWWQSEASDEERRAFPAALHNAYTNVLAKIEALGTDEKPRGMRVSKESDERWTAEIWNMLVENEGGKVPSYTGPDLHLDIPEVVLNHPKMEAAFQKPAVIGAMSAPGVLVAPFDTAVRKALTPSLKSIIKDASEPRKTRATAIMVLEWMEDFEEDCWYSFGQGEENATNMRDRYPLALADIHAWIDAAPVNAIPMEKSRDFDGLDHQDRLWTNMWKKLVESEEEHKAITEDQRVRVQFREELFPTWDFEAYLSEDKDGVLAPYGQDMRLKVVTMGLGVVEDTNQKRNVRLLGAAELVKARDYLSTRNTLWHSVNDVPATVVQLNNVFEQASKIVQAWAEELGEDKPMAAKGDVQETEETRDADDDAYVLSTLKPIPTADELAIEIWDAAVLGDAKVFEAEAEKAAADAEKPGAKWAHGSVRVTIPAPVSEILKDVEFDESPNVTAALKEGYFCAPLAKELDGELWTAAVELRHERAELTRPLNLAGRFLSLVSNTFDRNSEVWLKTPAEVQAIIDDCQTAYANISADLAATEEGQELEARTDPDELEGLEKYANTLWNNVAQVEEWARDEAREKRRAEAREAKKHFRVYLPDAFRAHSSVEGLKLKETFQAPLAPDAWVRRKLAPLADAIIADQSEPRATRLAAVNVKELLRIFSYDWPNFDWKESDGDEGRAYRTIMKKGYELAAEWVSEIDDSEPIELKDLLDDSHTDDPETVATKLWDRLVESEPRHEKDGAEEEEGKQQVIEKRAIKIRKNAKRDEAEAAGCIVM